MPEITPVERPTINNEWITLTQTKKGVTVQRKFAGMDTFIDEENNEVKYCTIRYWQRELYPEGGVIKTELKTYSLQDLAITESEENGITYVQDALPVLSGFIQLLGYSGIINPARETLENHVVLEIDAPNGYPLREKTRPKTIKE